MRNQHLAGTGIVYPYFLRLYFGIDRMSLSEVMNETFVDGEWSNAGAYYRYSSVLFPNVARWFNVLFPQFAL
jgi:hypothetical protein